MHTSDLVELSGMIAMHGGTFVRGHGRLSDRGVREYWSASRARCDRWVTTLSALQRSHAAPRLSVLPLLEEVFATEILTRVWTAVASERDRRDQSRVASPVVRNILLGHLDARNRALHWMARAYEQGWDAAVEANRLRSRSERWTDLLLAHLLPECPVDGCAFDRARVGDFADDLPATVPPAGRNAHGQAGPPNATAQRVVGTAGELLRVSLRTAFPAAPAPGPNADLNARIAYSIASSFPAEHIEATGPFANLWIQRLQLTADDLRNSLDEWLQEDGSLCQRRC
jgi:hypothetical protein